MTVLQRSSLWIHIALAIAIVLPPARWFAAAILPGPPGEAVGEPWMLDSRLFLGTFALANAVPYLLLAAFVGFATWRWVRGFGKGMLFAADVLAILALLLPFGGSVVIFSVATDGGNSLELWWPELVALIVAVIAAGFASGVAPPWKRVA